MQVYSPSKISQQLETFLNSVANGLGHTMSHAMSQTFSETVVAPVATKAPKALFLAAAQAAMQAEDKVSKPKTVKKTKSSADAAPKRVKKVKAPKEDTVVSKPKPVEEAGVDPAQQQEEQPPEEAGVEPKQPEQQQQEQPKEAEQEPKEQPEESVEPEQQQEPAEQQQEPAEQQQEPAEQQQEPAEQQQEPAEQQQEPAEQQQEVKQPAAKLKKVKKTKTESEDKPKRVRKSSAKPEEETKISPIRVRQTKEFVISDSENEAPQKVQEPAKPKKVVRKPRVAPKAEGEDKPKRVRKSRAKLKPETEKAKKPKSKEFYTTDDYNKVKPSPAMIALMAVKEIPESEDVPDKSDSEAKAPAPAIVKKRRTSLKKVESSDDEKLDEATGEQVIDEDALSKLTIQTLKGMCKTRNLKISGNKAALVQRLIETDGIAHIIPTTATVVQKVKKTKRLAVFSKVDSELKLIPCPGREHMLMDEATGLVFLDEDPSTAVGFIEHGEVFGLDSEHITVCKNMGIRYSWTEDYLC
ncbi:orf58-like protein [Ranavirus ambystoma1]|uniref:Orf58-like protein n=1 Tax=Ranavirus ambystoma1 TaxID=265294 RepID=A0A0U2R9D8_9VIRU|nr:orf58-like protein [Ambystoma tigrinum virus]